MTANKDKALLELAARAIGLTGEVEELWNGHSGIPGAKMSYGMFVEDKGEGNFFSPFADDGDAFRLAVKLRLTVSIRAHEVKVFRDDTGEFLASISTEGADHYAATRRAIVRAAAEIGKKP